jgi:hypothetical protein
MKYLPSLLSVPLQAAGCGGDPPPPITIQAAGVPLIATQPDGGDWQVITPDAEGEATVELDGPYALAWACTADDNPYVGAILAGDDDRREWTLGCAPTEAPSYADVTIEIGGGVASGQAWMYATGASGLGRLSSTGDNLSANPGTYDIVFIEYVPDDRAPHYQIQRGVVLDAGPHTLRFDPDGVMTVRHGDVTNLPAGQTDHVASGILVTANHAYVEAPPRIGTTDGWVFPASALSEGDRQFLGVRWGDGETLTIGGVGLPAGDGPVAVPLPDPIASAVVTRTALPSMTWTSDEHGWNGKGFYVLGTTSWYLSAYPGAAGFDDDRLDYPDVTAIPGWDSDLTVSADGQARLNLWIEEDDRFADLYYLVP